MISSRAVGIEPSVTLAINAKVKALKKQGADIVDFGIGEPDFDTPNSIKRAAIDAINKGLTKYTAAEGTPELREAIAKKLKTENKLDYKATQIVVSNGAKHALTNAFLAILNKGDEVIIPSPYWASYADIVKLADGVPVLAETANFQIDEEKLREAVTEKTKAVMLNSPNNPTGAVFSKRELEEVADLAVENNIYVVSDEIYEKFIYGAEHASIASFNKEIYDRSIVVNGFSKTYAMTGWRLGYAAGPSDIMTAIASIQSQMTSCPNSIAQAAALEALQCSTHGMINEFDKRRKYIVKRLVEMGMNMKEPRGAFYVFPEVPFSSVAFANQLLEKAHIAVVPGRDFGSDGHVRISYATSMKNIEEGMNRLQKFVKS